MSLLRRLLVSVALSATFLVGSGTIDLGTSARAEARMILWYADVQYTYLGRTYRGYLGGYKSLSDAQYYANQWKKGLGPKLNPKINRYYHD